MITIKKILVLIFISLIPAFLYEVAAITFYCFTLGTAPWGRVHKVAWTQDLVILLPCLCLAILFYGLYYEFLREEEPTIKIPRYERPKHERYSTSPDPD